ncbi:pentapeptide repeat-containing protein [Erysipelothrix anatis]|uniref:pentapeptide repeat-containing protein n=1 Tax=Erysipelothrix anatis TaxID=2683713 RepID=UPI00135B4480|nr:pentapeptide repeat-containing protein [Erysipelothrix anatis]
MNYIEEQHFTDIEMCDESLDDQRYIDCTFENCKFENIELQNTTLLNCTFKKCTIINPTSNFGEVNNASFENCNLIGVSWGMFTGPSKHRRVLNAITNTFMKYNSFINLSLKKQSFVSNSFQGSSFELCELSEASFKACSLDATTFTNCDLKKADFRDARYYVIDITSNQLKGSKFSFPEALTLLEQTGIIID